MAKEKDLVWRVLHWLRFFLREMKAYYLAKKFVCVRFTGVMEGQGEEVSVLYSGRQDWLHPVNMIFFKGQAHCEQLGVGSRWFPRRTLASRSHDSGDVVVVEETPLMKILSPHRLRIPSAVVCEVALGTDAEDYRSRLLGQTMRKHIRRAEREDFGVVFSNKEEDIKFFYEEMMIPACKVRHGKAAYVTPYSLFLERIKNLEVLFLTKEGKRIAGTVCYHDPKTGWLDLWKNGIIPEHLQNSNAMHLIYVRMYWEIMKRAHERGDKLVCYGKVAPVLGDGLMSSKIQWGCDVKHDFSMPTLAVDFLSSKAKNVLSARPLLLARSGALHGLMYFEANQQEPALKLKNLLNGYEFSSLAGIDIVISNQKEPLYESLGEVVERLPYPVRLHSSLDEVL